MAAIKKEKNTVDLKARAIPLADLVGFQDGAIVSREVVSQPTGTVTAFAFDEGQQLSEHTAPFDALALDLDGEAEITIGGKVNRIKPGRDDHHAGRYPPRRAGGDAVQDAPGHDQEEQVSIPIRPAPDRRPTILLTNDDGFYHENIQVLFRKLRALGTTYIVAPDRERSACSLAVTLRRPLRAQRVKPRIWAVEGTPVDCIYIALGKLLPRRPDLIVSGMNPGPNLGQQDINYSGTVAGAIQGTFNGIPSIAVSLLRDDKGRFDLGHAAGIVRTIAAGVLAGGLPTGTALNVNIPPPPVRGVKITRLGWKFYDPEIIEKTDPRDSSYFWIGTGTPRRVGDKGTDVMAAHDGYVSLTPLHTDMTAPHAIRSPKLRRLAKSLWR